IAQKMKPKVKGLKFFPPKKELENKPETEPHVPTQLIEDTAAKQLKHEKLSKLKLKKSEKIKQLLLQKKKEKKLQLQLEKTEPSKKVNEPIKKSLPESEQTKKKLKQAKAPLAVKAAKPVKANGSTTATTTTAAAVAEKSSQSTTIEPVRDPLLRAEIADYLRQRSACTVRVRRVPNRLRFKQIGQLCSGIQAYRVPWNYAAGRHKGVAFLEFASPEAAKRAATEISSNKTLGFRLTAAIQGVFGEDDDAEMQQTQQQQQQQQADGSADRHDEDAFAGNVDAYNCRRVIVCGLHPFTTGQELKDLVSQNLFNTTVERVDFQHGSKQLRKNSPAVAFLTFTDERRALEAVKKLQGQEIRGRLTSWMLHKRPLRSEHQRDRTQLVAFGVSKRVTDEDLLKAFPNSKSIDVKQGHGMAVVTYASETDCRTDFDACKGGVVQIGKARLRVEFGAAHHRPAEERKSSANSSKKQQEQQQQQRLPRQKPAEPKKPLNIDPSLFNKCQLVLKNFKPNTKDSDLSKFLPGTKRVYFTGNRRLAFVHFSSETAAAEALAKIGKELLHGCKLKAMYAMDKPDKKKVKQLPATTSGNDIEPMQVEEESVMEAEGGAEPAVTEHQPKLKNKKKKFKQKPEASADATADFKLQKKAEFKPGNKKKKLFKLSDKNKEVQRMLRA
ncbi:hypothetical protein BOX15_Mlig028579g2, partial [Macrostomum lignano]